jgi:microsomal dipeptidase-like Zn-dependent dipeptidase
MLLAMAADLRSRALALHEDPETVVVDVHTHGPRFVPQPARSLYRAVNRRTMPPDTGFDVLRYAGVDAIVGKAVGDPVVTRWYRGPAWNAVCEQLDQLIAEMASVGGEAVVDAAGVRNALRDGRPAVILGLEGADCIGEDAGRIDDLHRRGVRVIVPVHLGDNAIGTTSMPWQRYIGPLPAGRRPNEGLSRFGHVVVERMNALGMVLDVSHADDRTLHDVVTASRHPVIASHTGARACQDFARFLTDDQARAVAGTGGVIGLWPYFHWRRGVRDVEDMVRHIRHLTSVVGPEHLCIGTDMNGVPGLMDGYRGEADLPVITEALLRAGLSDDDARGVLGANFLRVLEAAAA